MLLERTQRDSTKVCKTIAYNVKLTNFQTLHISVEYILKLIYMGLYEALDPEDEGKSIDI